MADHEDVAVNLDNEIQDLTIYHDKSTDVTRYFKVVLNTGEKDVWFAEIGRYQTAESTDKMLAKMRTTTAPMADLNGEAAKLSAVHAAYQAQADLTEEHQAKLAQIGHIIDACKKELEEAGRAPSPETLLDGSLDDPKKDHIYEAVRLAEGAQYDLTRLIWELRLTAVFAAGGLPQLMSQLQLGDADAATEQKMCLVKMHLDLITLDQGATMMGLWAMAFARGAFR